MDQLLKAARRKFRFPSSKGPLTFEQLWDLPLQSKVTNAASLDGVAQELDRELQATARTSFVERSDNPLKAELQDKLALVVFVIETIQAENKAAREAAAKRAERDTLIEALHDRKKAEILNLSTEQLEARIKALES